MRKSRIILHTVTMVLCGVLGWLYWYKVGCLNGACVIWSNPWIATGYGALLGFFIAGLIPQRRRGEDITTGVVETDN